jgi:PsbP-like protein
MIVLREFIVVFLSVVVVFVAPAYAQNQTNQTQMQPQTQAWSTYDDPILGISIQHPKDWKAEEEPSTVTFRHYGLDNGSESIIANAMVITEPRPEGIETSEEYMKTTMNEFRGEITSEIHDINGTMIIDGKNTTKVDYSSLDEYGDTHTNVYFMVDNANDMMYYLSFNTDENRYPQYQPIFDKMASSFKVL